MMTRLAPARRWASVFSRVRKTPVDSMTTSAPTSCQADVAGSFAAVARTRRPATIRAPPSVVTVCRSLPWTESCLSK